MIRLYVVVEGQSEEAFVKDVLQPHLLIRSVAATPIIVATKRDPLTGQKLERGGGHWKQWQKDLTRLLMSQPREGVRVTTMFDLYGLPADFPEPAEHAAIPDTNRRAESLEAAMGRAIGDDRFLPYLQRHEFEALVLSGLEELLTLLERPEDLAGLNSLKAAIGSTPPEDIDDSPETSPSRRLTRAIPSYQKRLHGPLVLAQVGLPRLRAACPRFHAWLSKLERLGEVDSTSAECRPTR